MANFYNNIPIHNTFGIDVRADRYVEYGSVQELLDIVPSLAGQTFMHVGAGSNLLFTKDYKGIILHSAIRDMEVVDESEDVLVRVGAGVVWDDFVVYALGQGWSGVENLSLIPGEVGASAVQNIGAYGVEVKDVIYAVECVDLFDGTMRTFSRDECRYAYRQSVFKAELRGRYAVTYVTYKLSRRFVPHLDYGNLRQMLNGKDADGITAQMVREAVTEVRRAKLPDPDVVGNAGSFFMNPIVSEQKFRSLLELYPQMPHYIVDGGVKIPAGWLIEQCGWKGKALGRAAVHDRQALVLVNKGGATGEDVLRLCDTVRHFVFSHFGIDIRPEVNII